MTRDFYEEYMAVADLPAEFYLETVGKVFQTYDLPRACVLLFGQEGEGLSAVSRAECSSVLSIAQFGSTRSINAGAAAQNAPVQASAANAARRPRAAGLPVSARSSRSR